ncbi:Ctr copper transporter [Tolypocladium capitatum]|uniref:Copper transport protein n=1 Tax=Tolypocladium capitatum TaxID=45235 RepID=A0A2K3QCT4_9HYPO|nr:Ctr copper transporter [Tolypocladium capitatum]
MPMDMPMDMPVGGAGVNPSSSGHGSMGAMMMTMVFRADTATPLYANSWTPSNAGAYAGTCIFLVILATVARLLLAAKTLQEARWLDHDARRRYVVANGKVPLAEHVASDPDAKQMTLSENGVEETVFVVARKTHVARPWRFTVDPVRAAMDTVIVGVGYLLMLAVMTMNVGYFMSVLAGVFIGSLAVGRYSPVPEH